MKTTAVNSIPYPEDSDPPAGPQQIQELADLLDTLKWGSRNLKPTAGIVAASEDLTLTTSYQDVPGATLEITPAVASKLLVTAVFAFSESSSGGASGTVNFNGEDQAIEARANADVSSASDTRAQVYSLDLAVEKNTIKLRAKYLGAKGKALAGSTRFLYQLVAA